MRSEIPMKDILNIDWNEVIPKLSKKLKNDLCMEVATLLLDGTSVEAPYTKFKTARQRRRQQRKGNGALPKRLWQSDHPGQRLAAAGRKFKINKNHIVRQVHQDSGAGRIWAQLKESKGDTITTEGLYSLAKGHNMKGAALVSHFWADHRIDVVDDAK